MGINTHFKTITKISLMRFSPQQIYEIVGVSRDILRHWRKALPPIENRNGYRPCFTLGDALSLKIIKVLTEDFGIPVGKLSPLAPELFELCGQKSWSLIDDAWLLINPRQPLLQVLNQGAESDINDAVLWIPIGKLMHELRQAIMNEPDANPVQQLELALSPGNIKRQT